MEGCPRAKGGRWEEKIEVVRWSRSSRFGFHSDVSPQTNTTWHPFNILDSFSPLRSRVRGVEGHSLANSLATSGEKDKSSVRFELFTYSSHHFKAVQLLVREYYYYDPRFSSIRHQHMYDASPCTVLVTLFKPCDDLACIVLRFQATHAPPSHDITC